MRRGEGEEGERSKEEQGIVKSRDPHLAGGGQITKIDHHRVLFNQFDMKPYWVLTVPGGLLDQKIQWTYQNCQLIS